jgi:hypothetical protein
MVRDHMTPLRSVNVTRYITPLREGGSLPGLVEADDGFMYVLKFRGAGQGKKALIAELIGCEVARALGLHVPELVFAQLDVAFGRIEGDEEIQDLLKSSVGVNLGVHYLSGAVTFDPVVTPVDASLASRIVWLDSLLLNVDRTVRNTNLLWWHKEIWVIDHGASLYFHHSWTDWDTRKRPFQRIKDHVLLPAASKLEEADRECRSLLNDALIKDIVNQVPDDWLDDHAFEDPASQRDAYYTFLTNRIADADFFVEEANYARAQRI